MDRANVTIYFPDGEQQTFKNATDLEGIANTIKFRLADDSKLIFTTLPFYVEEVFNEVKA